VSTNGNYYFDAGHQRYLAQSGGNLFIGGFGEAYINGNRVLHVGNGLSDMTNNVGFINSIAVAAPRIASSDSSGTLTNVGLEMVDARTIRLVLSFVNQSGGGGQGG
jgi:hypothetical protein